MVDTSPRSTPPGAGESPLLDVRDLEVDFVTDEGDAKAVRGVSYTLERGRTLAIVGESGSGKSTSARGLLRLLPSTALIRGQVLFDGVDLLALSERSLRSIRGQRASVIFQDALSSLNPVKPVGKQIAEMYRLHHVCSRAEAQRRAIESLGRVGIPSPARRAQDHPARFSGGMRQRVVIAMALALEPALLIADEPTTALDATVQGEILDLLNRLQEELSMAMVLITHDLAVAADVADEVVVMYAGRIVERSPMDKIWSESYHPYTTGLLQSLPRWDRQVDRLPAIPGTPPRLVDLPPGCPFAARCGMATEICQTTEPELAPMANGRWSACHHADEVMAQRDLTATVEVRTRA